MKRELLDLFGLGSRSASLAAGQPGNGTPLEESAPHQGYDASVRGEHARYADPSQRGHAGCGSPGRVVSRVGFLGAGLGAMIGAVGLYAPVAAAGKSTQVWGLDPGCGDGAGCHACSACRSHAVNKVFASAADADGGRAHAFCKCQVVSLTSVPRGVFEALFLAGGGRNAVDRRWQWVQAVLTQAPAVPSPTPPPAAQPIVQTSPGSAGTTGQGAGAAVADAGVAGTAVADTAVHAVLGRVRILREHGGRALYVEVHSSQTVAASASLARGPRTLARHTARTIQGKRTIRIAIPAGVGAGPSRLRVTFRNAAGRSKLVSRTVTIPSAHPRPTAFAK